MLCRWSEHHGSSTRGIRAYFHLSILFLEQHLKSWETISWLCSHPDFCRTMEALVLLYDPRPKGVRGVYSVSYASEAENKITESLIGTCDLFTWENDHAQGLETALEVSSEVYMWRSACCTEAAI